MFCKKCGGKIESYASHCPFCGEAVPNNSVEATFSGKEETHKVYTSVGKWILISILMAIPPINLIFLFIWAFSSKTKDNLTFRNWAKTQLLFVLIGVILTAVIIVIALPYIMVLINQFNQLIQ